LERLSLAKKGTFCDRIAAAGLVVSLQGTWKGAHEPVSKLNLAFSGQR
jgi:hypothetical protein